MRPLKEARRSACISRSINESKGIEKVRGDMKLHVITKILIFLLIITLSLASYTIAADKPLVISNVDQGYFDEIQKDPRLLINEYCKEVFLGSEDIGIELVKLSLEKAIKEQALAPKFGENAGKILFLANDPLLVVESYKLKDLKISKTKGEATVCYKQLAYTKGGMYNRGFIIDRKDNVLVKFNIRYIEGKWWIIDPPLSHVSKEALINHLAQLLNLMNKVITEENNWSESQREAAASLTKSVKFLNELQ
jgi:hypothetical protein